MNSIRKSFTLKIISMILVVAFLNLEIAWAYPDRAPQNHTLAVPSMNPVTPFTAHEKMISQMKRFKVEQMGTLWGISRCLFGRDASNGADAFDDKPQYFNYFSQSVRHAWGSAVEGIDFPNIMPLEYWESMAKAETQIERDAICEQFIEAMPRMSKDGVLVIPYEVDTEGVRRVVLVARKKSSIAVAKLETYPGKKLMVADEPMSEEYVLKEMVWDYSKKEMVAQKTEVNEKGLTAQQSEVVELTEAEPEVLVEADTVGVSGEKPVVTSKKFTTKIIAMLLTIFTGLSVLAGNSTGVAETTLFIQTHQIYFFSALVVIVASIVVAWWYYSRLGYTSMKFHRFKSVDGIRVAIPFGMVSSVFLGFAAFQHFVEGNLSSIGIVSYFLGSYLGWAAVRYLMLGIQQYVQYRRGSASRDKSMFESVTAFEFGVRGVIFRYMSPRSQELITLHQYTHSSLVGAFSRILPLISYFTVNPAHYHWHMIDHEKNKGKIFLPIIYAALTFFAYRAGAVTSVAAFKLFLQNHPFVLWGGVFIYAIGLYIVIFPKAFFKYFFKRKALREARSPKINIRTTALDNLKFHNIFKDEHKIDSNIIGVKNIDVNESGMRDLRVTYIKELGEFGSKAKKALPLLEKIGYEEDGDAAVAAWNAIVKIREAVAKEDSERNNKNKRKNGRTMRSVLFPFLVVFFTSFSAFAGNGAGSVLPLILPVFAVVVGAVVVTISIKKFFGSKEALSANEKKIKTIGKAIRRRIVADKRLLDDEGLLNQDADGIVTKLVDLVLKFKLSKRRSLDIVKSIIKEAGAYGTVEKSYPKKLNRETGKWVKGESREVAVWKLNEKKLDQAIAKVDKALAKQELINANVARFPFYSTMRGPGSKFWTLLLVFLTSFSAFADNAEDVVRARVITQISPSYLWGGASVLLVAAGIVFFFRMRAILSNTDWNIARLDSKDARIRQKAARALGGRKAARAVDALINALGDKNVDVRGEAFDALVKTGKFATHKLSTAMHDFKRSGKICVRAAKVLGKIGYAMSKKPKNDIEGYEYVKNVLIQSVGKNKMMVAEVAYKALDKMGALTDDIKSAMDKRRIATWANDFKGKVLWRVR